MKRQIKRSNKQLQHTRGMSAHRQNLIVAIVLIVLVLIAALVAYRAHQHALAMKPTVLTISRSGPYIQSQSKDESFTVYVKDSTIANTLQNDVQVLPLFPPGVVSCARDDGVSYRLKFAASGLTVTADATGCQGVKLSNSTVVYRATQQFWGDVHKATGKSIDPEVSAKYYY